jgi:hypothetical protein
MLEERRGLSNCVAAPAPKPSKATVLTWRRCCWWWGTKPRKPRRRALHVLLLWPLLLLLLLLQLQVLHILGCLWRLHNRVSAM